MQETVPVPARAPEETRPRWSHPREIPACVLERTNLRRTLLTALVVGTILFCINHLAAVLAGRAGAAAYVATGLSFVVPFFVANLGLLVATRVGRESEASTPTWTSPAEARRVLAHRASLRRTLVTALVVGSLYFAINQLPAVLGGHATAAHFIAGGVTYLVPFCVATIGLLLGSRRR